VAVSLVAASVQLPNPETGSVTSNAVETSKDLENRAKDIFMKTGHAYGALDIDFSRACKGLKTGSGSIEDNWNTVQLYYKAMEALDHQSKVLYAVGEALAATNHIQPFEVKVQLTLECEKRSRKLGAKPGFS
jgi:hypothetical protein